jgi:eukaryotic-like serine/threonine-protein kinase
VDKMAIQLFLDKFRSGIYEISEVIQSIQDYQYEVQDRIGCGGNSVVYKCVELITGNEYAIKFLLNFSAKSQKRFAQEIKLLKETHHDHIIEYIDCGSTVGAYKNNPNKRIPFIIMNLAEKNLLEYIKHNETLVKYEEYIAQFKGLASALSILHQRAIHRDIKPENILIKGETWILSDFGLCKFINKEDYNEISSEDEVIGPKYWMSPEALNHLLGNNDEIAKCSDVYQLCSIFWFVVTKRHPTGVITKNDWNGPDFIFVPIFRALAHNSLERPCDGQVLLNLLNEATLSILDKKQVG